MSDDYVEVTDAQLTYKNGVGQDLWRQFGGNVRNHEARLLELLAIDKQSIVDNFFSDTGSAPDGNGTHTDPYLYDETGGSAAFRTMMGASGDHALRVNTAAVADTKTLLVRADRLALRLNQDMQFTFEARVKDPGATACSNILIGYTDNATPSDESDCIGWLKGSTAGKWRFRVAKGGVQSEIDNQGNRATWQKLKHIVTRSGGGSVFQVEAFIDGASIGAPITTNIPDSVILRMAFGAITPGAGTTDLRLDRWSHRWNAIPENS